MTCDIHVDRKANLESQIFGVAILFCSFINLCFTTVSDQRFSTHKNSQEDLIEFWRIIMNIIIIY